MSKLDKLIQKILEGRQTSYEDAERILLFLGFSVKISSSHHVFRKDEYKHVISLKRRSQLQKYQIKDLQEVLIDHGYEK